MLAALVILAGMVGFALMGGPSARAATVSGPDLTASIGVLCSACGENVDGFEIANLGNAAATGTTTITLSAPPSVSLQGVMYYPCSTSPPGTCTFTQSLSPTGSLVMTYTGTIAAGAVLSDFQVVGAISSMPTSGEVEITVTNPGDVNPANNTTDVVYGGPAPAVASLSPASGPPAGGTIVTLTGTNLGGGTVTIGGLGDTSTFCNDTMCTAETPGGASTAAVAVTTASGSASAGTFTYQQASTPPAPTVTGVSPATGPASGGTAVTVAGSNLTGGSVAFGGTAATGVSCTATSCTATSPAGSGTVNVTVTTGGGTSAAGTADQFTYQQASTPPDPTVTGISPSSGPAAGGTAVTVNGSNLTGGSVAFGGTAATGVSCSASSCTATSPAGTGTVDVTITTAGGTSATGSADRFTYAAVPPPSNLIPDPGFESAGIPADYWGSRLARSTAVVHSGSWALAQTARSSSGGWDLDSDANWYAPVSSGESYTAGIWVRSTAAVKVDLNLDLLDSGGNYVDSANGPAVTLAANTWTHLTITGIKPVAGEVYGGMEPNFSSAASGTVIYWDDMSLTSP